MGEKKPYTNTCYIRILGDDCIRTRSISFNILFNILFAIYNYTVAHTCRKLWMVRSEKERTLNIRDKKGGFKIFKAEIYADSSIRKYASAARQNDLSQPLQIN